MKVRTCQSCHYHNPGDPIACERCGISLADVPFTYLDEEESGVENSQDEPPTPKVSYAVNEKEPENARINPRETIVDKIPSLTFISPESGKKFQAKNGSVLGRTNIGDEVFKEIDTVSRVHAKVYFNGVYWEIEDVSKNGTYINGESLTKNKRYRINNGDTLHFSSQCSLKVQP